MNDRAEIVIAIVGIVLMLAGLLLTPLTHNWSLILTLLGVVLLSSGD